MGVPDNFCNWFVVEFDTPFVSADVWKDGGKVIPEKDEYKGDHAGAIIGFDTKRGQQVHARIASSFISMEQAFTNLKEVGGHGFDEIKDTAQQSWDDVLGRIQVGGGTDEQYRTFYSCLYRSLLFPRKFYEITENGDIVHYSLIMGKYFRDICILTQDSGIHSVAFSLCLILFIHLLTGRYSKVW